MDSKQSVFENFEVPDRNRILKIKKWLTNNGYLKNNHDCNILEIGYSKGGLVDNLKEFQLVNKYALDMHDRDIDNKIIFLKHDCNNGLPDFKETKFDIVFAGEVIEHIYDDKYILDEICNILRPNGLLILTTPNLFYLLNRLIFFFGKKPIFSYAPYHYHFYDIPVLTELVRKSGFKIKDIKSSHILISSRRNKYLGKVFEFLGDFFPSIGAHIILFAEKSEKKY